MTVGPRESRLSGGDGANPGAKFSDAGLTKLVQKSNSDDEITTLIRMRPSLPRHQFVATAGMSFSFINSERMAMAASVIS